MSVIFARNLISPINPEILLASKLWHNAWMHKLVGLVSDFLMGHVWERRKGRENAAGCVYRAEKRVILVSGPGWGRKNNNNKKPYHFDDPSLRPHQLHLLILNSWGLTAAAITAPTRLSNSSMDVHFPAERRMQKGTERGERKKERKRERERGDGRESKVEKNPCWHGA